MIVLDLGQTSGVPTLLASPLGDVIDLARLGRPLRALVRASRNG